MHQPQYNPESIRALFEEMAATYGRVNLITSFGFSALWRHQAVEQVEFPSDSCVVLDLMSGRGELWRSLAKRITASTRLIGVELSPEMARGTPRQWPFANELVIDDVLEWQPGEAFADVIVSTFGLKTFSREQQRFLAFKVARMLKAGGSFSFLEISVPPSKPLQRVYMFYLDYVIPLLGRLLLGNPDCYRMLGIYTHAFGNTGHFAECLTAAGLEVTRASFFFGCATGVKGRKPLTTPW